MSRPRMTRVRRAHFASSAEISCARQGELAREDCRAYQICLSDAAKRNARCVPCAMCQRYQPDPILVDTCSESALARQISEGDRIVRKDSFDNDPDPE